MSRESIPRLAGVMLVTLFFIEALRTLFSTTFGILYDQIFAGSPTAWLPISLTLVVLSMVAPLLADAHRIRQGKWWPAVFGVAASLARIPMTANDAAVRFPAALIVVAAGGAYLATELRINPRRAWTAAVVALAGDQLLRVAGNTYDLSLQQGFLLPLILLAVAASVCGIASTEKDAGEANVPLGAPVAFGAFIFLETSLLSVANATARWSGVSYEILAPVTLAVTLLCLLPAVADLVATTWVRLSLLWILPVGLMLGAAGYGALAAVGLMLAHASAILTWRAWTDASQRRRRPGAAVAWAMVFFLILNFANAFTFTYPYTLPFLRGYGWAVYLLAGLAAGLPLLAPRSAPTAAPRLRWPALVAGIVVVLACAILVWPHSTDNRVDVRAVRAATYNIHYGYDQRWGFNLAELAYAIRAEGVDFIALQEVDTGRMTSYMADDAYYLARALGMHQAYLPTVERLTGIAVLYRGSSESIEHILVTSRQEQTGVVHVEAGVDGRPFHMFGIWMGLSDEDTLRQIEEALAFLADRAPAAFGGDFNAEPDSPVVGRVLAAGLHDPFADLDIDPAPLTDPAVDPDKRIDYVFLRGATPRQAWVSTSLASDHRMVVVELDLTLPPLPDVVRP